MARPHRFIQSYTHHGRIGVLVEFSTGLSVTTAMDAFLDLSRNLAMHIAASNPDSVAALLQQPFVKDQGCSVREHLAQVSRNVDDEVGVIRFVRWDHSSARPEIEPPPERPAVAMRAA